MLPLNPLALSVPPPGDDGFLVRKIHSSLADAALALNALSTFSSMVSPPPPAVMALPAVASVIVPPPLPAM